MPRKPLELPSAVARNFVKDMRAFFAEKDGVKADDIAARGGGGMPQRIMAISVPASVLRITGAG